MVAESKEKVNYINFLWKGRLFKCTTPLLQLLLGNCNLIKIYFVCHYLTLHYLPHTHILLYYSTSSNKSTKYMTQLQFSHAMTVLLHIKKKIAFRETFKFRIDTTHREACVWAIQIIIFIFFVQNLYPAPLLLLLHYKCNNNSNQILHKCNNAMQYHFILLSLTYSEKMVNSFDVNLCSITHINYLADGDHCWI